MTVSRWTAQACPPCSCSVHDEGAPGPPLVLEHVTMQQGVECRITEPNGASTAGHFAIIRCTSSDVALRDYFLRVGGTVVDASETSPY